MKHYQFVTPYSPSGRSIAHITLPEDEVLKISTEAAVAEGHTYPSAQEAVDDFVAVHWATELSSQEGATTYGLLQHVVGIQEKLIRIRAAATGENPELIDDLVDRWHAQGPKLLLDECIRDMLRCLLERVDSNPIPAIPEAPSSTSEAEARD
jgi:hypothetical protein